MAVVIDTSVVIACGINEPHRAALLAITANEDLFSPPSLPWEVGNALSSLFKQRRLTVDQALAAIDLYQRMSVKLREIDLVAAIRAADRFRIYAYDAYMIQCAIEAGTDLLTLDRGLKAAARAAGVPLREVNP
jgi:predicted nucleic acid-binding protein